MDKLEHRKLRNKWFERGYQAGKRENPSGCICEFDGETDNIVSYCAVHAAERDRLMEIISDVLDSLPAVEPGGPCPVCWTYTHKSWCWYERAKTAVREKS